MLTLRKHLKTFNHIKNLSKKLFEIFFHDSAVLQCTGHAFVFLKTLVREEIKFNVPGISQYVPNDQNQKASLRS